MTEAGPGRSELAVEIAGAGATFLWLHALTSSRARERRRGIYDWDRLTSEFTVVRYDAAGHGESPGQPDECLYDWSRMADDARQVLRTLSRAPIVLGGASMGSVVSLHVATQDPSGLSALVLATPPAAWDARSRQAEGWRRAAHIVEKYGLDELRRRVASIAPPTEDKSLLVEPDFGYDVSEALFPAVLRGAASSDLPSRDKIAAISLPVLILAWPGDVDHPVETAEMLAETIPHSRLHIAASADDVRAWPEMVGNFLREVHREYAA